MNKIVKKINEDGRKINLLFDYSNMAYRCAFSLQRELHKTNYKDWGVFKHRIIETVLDYKSNFKNPNVILCIDKKHNKKYWRHIMHEGYKGNRSKQASKIPKDILFEQFSIMIDELKEYLPWKVVEVKGVEADDIVAVYAIEHPNENNVIVSPDKDFQQLQTNSNVYQYCPMKKTYLECVNPIKFKFEHLVRGDTGDGIPNVFSDLDTLVTVTKKQKILRQTKLNEMWDVHKNGGMKAVKNLYFSKYENDRFDENEKLIDLTLIPKKFYTLIKDEIKNYKAKGNGNTFFTYCNKNRLRQLVERANQV